MLVGYARTSTIEQSLDLQMDALKAAGCERIYADQVSGAREAAPEFVRVLEILREGDALVVWRLDRLGRTLKQLIELIGNLEKRGVGLRSLQENIETGSPGGRLVFHIFAALAEFERNIIRERTVAGLEAARSRGRRGGRPRKLSSAQRALVATLYREKKHPVQEICRMFGISRPTLYSCL